LPAADVLDPGLDPDCDGGLPTEVTDAGLDDAMLVPGDWGSALPADVAEPCLDPVNDPPVRDPCLEDGFPSLASALPVTEIVDSALDDVRDPASRLPDSDPACEPRRLEAEVADTGRDPDLPVTAVPDPGLDDWVSTLPIEPARDPFLPVSEVAEPALDPASDLLSVTGVADPARDPGSSRPVADVTDPALDPTLSVADVVEPARDPALPEAEVADWGRDEVMSVPEGGSLDLDSFFVCDETSCDSSDSFFDAASSGEEEL